MRRHRAHRGFTMVEMLTVIGIILLLIAIGVIGYSKIDKVAAGRSTSTRLQTCASLLSEYDAAATLAAIDGPYGGGAIYQRDQSGILPVLSNAPPAPQFGDVNIGNAMRYGTAVQNTAIVFQILQRISNSKTVLANLPSKAFLTAQSGSGPYMTGFGDFGVIIVGNQPQGPYMVGHSSNAEVAPVILDAWNNPIIFVPSGGLSGVILTVNGQRSLVNIIPVDNRPFWASAGADGNFNTGDDNIYSAQTKIVVTGPAP